MVLLFIFRQISAKNCTACKRLNLAPTFQAVEDDVSRFSLIASRL